MQQKHSGGFTLLEVIVAIALLLTFTIGTLAANTLATRTITINQKRSQANRLAHEAMEAILSIRAASFTFISSGTFYPVSTPTGWSLVSGTQQVEEFTRSITITPASRAIACEADICDLVSAGGITDPNTRHVSVSVVWDEESGNQNITLSNLITNWR